MGSSSSKRGKPSDRARAGRLKRAGRAKAKEARRPETGAPNRLIDIEKLARLPSFFMPEVSESRRYVAYYGNHTGVTELYVLDLKSGRSEQVTRGEVPRSIRYPVVWAPDERHIVIPKDTDGDEQNDIHVFDLKTRELSQVTNAPKKQEIPLDVSADGKWILFASNRKGQLNLYRVPLEGGDAEQISDYANPIYHALFSPDGRKVAYIENESEDLKNLDVYVMDADGSDKQRVLRVREGSQDQVSDWSPDGRSLAVSSDASGIDRPGVLDLASGEVRWLGSKGVEEYAYRFSRSGSMLASLRNRDSVISPVVYDLKRGSAVKLRFPPGVAVGADFVDRDTKLVSLCTTPTRRAEMVLYDLKSHKTRTLVPAVYGDFSPGMFAGARHVWYPSSDGRRVPAVIYRPRRAARGQKPGAVLYVHGGPTGQWFLNFDPYAQFLADMGYVVLMPNVRGSTGYGVEWRDLNRMDWGGGDLDDVAAGVEWLRRKGLADPARVGIFGGSYGGYMAYIAVTKKPELWKAGVAWVGISHLRTLYNSDMEHFKYYFREQMGDPDKNKELWEDRSPLNFAEKMKAKLLMIHGVTDPRCPVEQARIFKKRLDELGRKEGVDYEYVELSKEGHGSTDIEQKVRAFKFLEKFFEKSL
jgi:dipeptidyl aminopeptidase/acylaminoacyl peptidase